jgi:hypothetical protein
MRIPLLVHRLLNPLGCAADPPRRIFQGASEVPLFGS